MKLDIDIVKKLLLVIEERDVDTVQLKIPDDINFSIAIEHLYLLKERGLINLSVKYADNIPCFIHSCSLTWDGHEFLDTIRNDNIWIKLKDTIKDKGGNVAFDFIVSMANEIAKKYFLGE